MKEKIANVLHWVGFAFSAYMLIFLTLQAFDILEEVLPFVGALIPFVLAVLVKRKWTERKSFWPWSNK